MHWKKTFSNDQGLLFFFNLLFIKEEKKSNPLEKCAKEIPRKLTKEESLIQEKMFNLISNL